MSVQLLAYVLEYIPLTLRPVIGNKVLNAADVLVKSCLVGRGSESMVLVDTRRPLVEAAINLWIIIRLRCFNMLTQKLTTVRTKATVFVLIG